MMSPSFKRVLIASLLAATFSVVVVGEDNSVSKSFFSVSIVNEVTSDYSQDFDLVNYDSAACVCDVTDQCDFDCACEASASCNYSSATSRVVTYESKNTLVQYPYCSTIRQTSSGDVPVTQINNIACLAFTNTPYHGEFFDAAASSTTNFKHDNSQAQFPINHQTSYSTSTTTIDDTLKTVTGFFGPDQFGFCSVQGYFSNAIKDFSSTCADAASSNSRLLTLDYGYVSSSVQATPTKAAGSSTDKIVKVSVTTAATTTDSTSSETGYTFGDIITFGSVSIPFGGTYITSGTQVSSSTITVNRIKRAILSTDAQRTAKEISVTPAANTNYIVYYTTVLDTTTTPEFQILKINAGTLGTPRVDFVFAKYSDIASVVTYTDRINTYVQSLFYPLKQMQNSSLLVSTLLLLLALFIAIM